MKNSILKNCEQINSLLSEARELRNKLSLELEGSIKKPIRFKVPKDEIRFLQERNEELTDQNLMDILMRHSVAIEGDLRDAVPDTWSNLWFVESIEMEEIEPGIFTPVIHVMGTKRRRTLRIIHGIMDFENVVNPEALIPFIQKY